ncbi:Protein LAS1 [Ooceraea biroi]|uniref:Protein LAS1 n=1 Tax=Ooceraea biroi TaxID=2015173 RepID=A0A026W851_OOCBI|nr:Protein LAS1 [Ooceraea biroi]
MYYEHDLSLMYSTTIMRLLNHISNLGHTRETSLFKIADQLRIPAWIVNLRHEAAHGHELPSISVLRIAINILLKWLHDEYWVAEARAMEEYYTKENIAEEVPVEEEEGLEEVQAFADLIEIWSAVSLYINAGHELVSNLPDEQLQGILQDLRTYMLSQYNNKTLDGNENEYIVTSRKTIKLLEKEYNLKAAQALILSEISVCLTGNESTNTHRKGDMICDALCRNTAFLSNKDILKIFQQGGQKTKSNSLKGKILPSRILQCWKDIIVLLHRNGILETLVFKLLDIVNQEQESKERRTSAALWISSIVYSFIQLDIAQNISHVVEHTLRKLDTKTVSQHIRKQLRCNYPYLQNVLWLDISSTMPHFLTDINFLSKLLLHANEFSKRLIEPILKFAMPKIDAQMKEHLLCLLKTYTSLHVPKHNDKDTSNGDICDKIYTVENFKTVSTATEQIHARKNTSRRKTTYVADQVIRNLHWKSALDTHQWIESPIGLLPWQMDSLRSLEPLEVNTPRHPVSVLDSRIIAGIINQKNLGMQSIKWNKILRKKRRTIRKREKAVAVIMDRALEID